MRRRLPFFTPASVAFALILLLGMGFAVWKVGGQWINPAPVSAKSQPGVKLQGFASHAEFEQDCTRCHNPLVTSQVDLCLSCHETVKQQVDHQQGLHGTLGQSGLALAGQNCAACHPDHRGRDFDPASFALAGLNHNQTRFPLTGKHVQIKCEACHMNNQYQSVALECAACHKEPTEHVGMFDANCAGCHNTTDWKQAAIKTVLFDHQKLGFQLANHALKIDGTPLACADCHAGGMGAARAQAACRNCHVRQNPDDMKKHQAQYGAGCLACHDGADRMVPFDHARFFALDGKHAEVQCTSCHAHQTYKGTPLICAACHAEPKIHAGAFGTQCQACHTTTAWAPAALRKHAFPLDHGGKGEQVCQTCHQKSYAEYTCYGCHDHQPDPIKASHLKANVSAALLPDCTRCHPGSKR